MTTTALAQRTFDDFYAAYYPRVLGLATALYATLDAEDLAQETMARAFTAYGRLDPRRDPWPWLVAIARNIACDRLRSERAAPDPGAAVVGTDPMTPYDAAVAAEERRLVRRALARLSSTDRRLLVLREWHELSFQEMASLVGGEPGTLRQQVFRARRRFARAFTELGGRALGVAALTGRWCRSRGGGVTAMPYGTQVAAAVTAVAATAGLLGGPGGPLGPAGPGSGPRADAGSRPAGITAAPARGATAAYSASGGPGSRGSRIGLGDQSGPPAPAGPGGTGAGDPVDPPTSSGPGTKGTIRVGARQDGPPAMPGSSDSEQAAASAAGHRVWVGDRNGRDVPGDDCTLPMTCG
jgi:RNA polymerase sigma-70 factor (ECF subfamily)